MNNAPINFLIKHLEQMNKHFTAGVLTRPTGVPMYYRQGSVRNQIQSLGAHSRAVCCADTLGATATLLGTLDPVAQTAGNSPINCSGINQLDLFNLFPFEQ